MKPKLWIDLALVLIMLGCSLFSPPAVSPSKEDPELPTSQPIKAALLPDPATGLDGLDRYHQELTVSFRGTVDGKPYEWTNAHQYDVWKKAAANFWARKTSATGAASMEMLVGRVDQAQYLRIGEGAPCDVSWGAGIEGTHTAPQPAGMLPPIAAAAEAGTETVNEIPSRHYTISKEKPGKKVAGEVWLAENGGYVVRYVLTVSGEENAFGKGVQGEQSFEYNLTQVNSTDEVSYPVGCLPVLADFPVMDGARNLQRLPEAVDYTVAAEAAVISQFYQDQLVEQGWTFVNIHEDDPKNVLLIFTNKEEGKAVSILLSARGSSAVWVSAILRPWESSDVE